MPSSTPGDIVQKLGEEHGRFLVAELNVKVSGTWGGDLGSDGDLETELTLT